MVAAAPFPHTSSTTTRTFARRVRPAVPGCSQSVPAAACAPISARAPSSRPTTSSRSRPLRTLRRHRREDDPAECVFAREAGFAYTAVCRIDNLANGVAGHALEVEEYRANARALADSFANDIRATLDVVPASRP